MNNQKALDRIKKCKEKQSDFLDLGELGLTAIPKEVFELHHLKRLNLGSRYYENGEWINVKKSHETNKIEEIPKAIVLLSNLEELSLEGNPIKDTKLLKDLSYLKRLNIGRTLIRALDFLPFFEKLEALSLNGLSIRSIPQVINNIKSPLIALDLHNNLINKIEGLGDQASLEHLNLSTNLIGKMEGLESLKNLKSLYLGLNQIQIIEQLEELNNLETLSLGYLGGHYKKNVVISYTYNLFKIQFH